MPKTPMKWYILELGSGALPVLASFEFRNNADGSMLVRWEHGVWNEYDADGNIVEWNWPCREGWEDWGKINKVTDVTIEYASEDEFIRDLSSKDRVRAAAGLMPRAD